MLIRLTLLLLNEPRKMKKKRIKKNTKKEKEREILYFCAKIKTALEA